MAIRLSFLLLALLCLLVDLASSGQPVIPAYQPMPRYWGIMASNTSGTTNCPLVPTNIPVGSAVVTFSDNCSNCVYWLLTGVSSNHLNATFIGTNQTVIHPFAQPSVRVTITYGGTVLADGTNLPTEYFRQYVMADGSNCVIDTSGDLQAWTNMAYIVQSLSHSFTITKQ